jgi:hypothetical protein
VLFVMVRDAAMVCDVTADRPRRHSHRMSSAPG